MEIVKNYLEYRDALYWLFNFTKMLVFVLAEAAGEAGKRVAERLQLAIGRRKRLRPQLQALLQLSDIFLHQVEIAGEFADLVTGVDFEGLGACRSGIFTVEWIVPPIGFGRPKSQGAPWKLASRSSISAKLSAPSVP